MSDVLIYDDCTLEMLVSLDWYPVLCQVEVNYKLQQEVILKTGVNSGIFREKATRLNEAFCSVRGITPIENGDVISVFYMLQESIRTAPQEIRIKYVDQAGGNQQISGTAYIVNIDMPSPQADFMTVTIDFEFSGAITIENVTAPPSAGLVLYSDLWTTTAGQNYISGASAIHAYSLVGKTILEVDREGVQYDLIANNSTPGNRQCSWNTSSNRLVFENDFSDSETVFVIFR